jgi:hypothetical protein
MGEEDPETLTHRITLPGEGDKAALRFSNNNLKAAIVRPLSAVVVGVSR